MFLERLAEEERLREEEEAARAEAEVKKREEEERHAAIRKAREEERAKADEQARLQRQREEEAEARRAARAAEKASASQQAVRKPVFAAARENGKEDAGVWRRSTPAANSTPFASSRSSTIPPARPESPAGGAAPVKRYTPGALRAQREAAGGSAPSPISRTSAAVSGGSRPSSPAPARDDKAEEDGFQKVEKKVWKPRQLR